MPLKFIVMVNFNGLILFLFLIFFKCVTSALQEKISLVHSCLKDAKDIPNNRLNGRTLAGIIGFGWDDLRSIRTKPIFFESFDECRGEPTGHYLIPDNIVAVPILKTQIDKMANLFESFEYFKQEVSNVFTASASAGFSFLSASASFSKISQKTKENFAKCKSSLLQTKLNYEAFTLSQDSVGNLAAGFRGRIEEIADAINRKLFYRAKYLSEVIIKEFGTHYISSADIGAMVEQKTFVETKYSFSGATSLQGIQFAAAVGFTNLFNGTGTLSASFSSSQTVSTQDINALTNLTKLSYFESLGGPDINTILAGKANFSIDNIVPYRFDGDWLYQVISKENFQSLSYGTLLNIQNLLKNATETYYERNTIEGCMDMNSLNFDFQANFDNSSCISNNDSYPFGGFYQTCTPISGPDSRCNGIRQSNEFVGGMKCNELYFESVKFFDTIYEFEVRKVNHPIRKCKGIWPIRKCRDVDVFVDYIDKVKVESFWCRKKPNAVIPVEYGAMFGGVYEGSELNLITGKPGCPGSFKPYRMGRSTSICLSYQYEQDHKFSIPFAGFFSCQSQGSGQGFRGSNQSSSLNNGGFRNNNFGESGSGIRNSGRPISGFRNNNTSGIRTSRPNNDFIASTFTQSSFARCPEGYSQQLLPIEMTCHVFYCIKKHTIANIFQHPKLYRPPYSLPQIAANNFSESTIYATYDGIEILTIPLNKISIPNSFRKKFGGAETLQDLNSKGTDMNVQNSIIDAFIQEVEEKIEALSNNHTATPTELMKKLKNNNSNLLT